jgi:hypothetical protein
MSLRVVPDVDGDGAATRQAIDTHDGPVVLACRSYSGEVITGGQQAPRPLAASSISRHSGRTRASRSTPLIAEPLPGAPIPPILSPRNGFLLLGPRQVRDAVCRRPAR